MSVPRNGDAKPGKARLRMIHGAPELGEANIEVDGTVVAEIRRLHRRDQDPRLAPGRSEVAVLDPATGQEALASAGDSARRRHRDQRLRRRQRRRGDPGGARRRRDAGSLGPLPKPALEAATPTAVPTGCSPSPPRSRLARRPHWFAAAFRPPRGTAAADGATRARPGPCAARSWSWSRRWRPGSPWSRSTAPGGSRPAVGSVASAGVGFGTDAIAAVVIGADQSTDSQRALDRGRSDDRRPAPPALLRVRSADVAVAVEPVRARGDEIEVPPVERVGWLRGGPRPGEPGRTVLIGHRDSTSGPAPFAALATLERGARVEVIDDRGQVRHTVSGRSSRCRSPSSPPRGLRAHRSLDPGPDHLRRRFQAGQWLRGQPDRLRPPDQLGPVPARRLRTTAKGSRLAARSRRPGLLAGARRCSGPCPSAVEQVGAGGAVEPVPPGAAVDLSCPCPR